MQRGLFVWLSGMRPPLRMLPCGRTLLRSRWARVLALGGGTACVWTVRERAVVAHADIGTELALTLQSLESPPPPPSPLLCLPLPPVPTSWWPRAGALLLDGLLMNSLTSMLWQLTVRFLGSLAIPQLIALVAGPFIFDFAFYWLKWRTPGRWLSGLRVVQWPCPASGPFLPPSALQVAVRRLGFAVNAAFVLDYWFGLGDPLGRCLHDRIAGTIVISDSLASARQVDAPPTDPVPSVTQAISSSSSTPALHKAAVKVVGPVAHSSDWSVSANAAASQPECARANL
jgi:hypothetical protein